MNYRVALILPQSRQVVAASVDGSFLLPQITIPLWERPAEQLTRLIEERWHIKSIVLDIVLDDRPESPCAIIEIRTSLWKPSTAGLTQVNLDKISDDSLTSSDRTVLREILRGADSGRGPFSRIGWIDDVEAWIHQITKDYGYTLTGETLQLNADGRFCLIRFTASTGSGYWLKATGEPNTREFTITTFLSAASPKYLPRLLAVRGDWNAWLTEEHGASMRDSDSLVDFRRAVHNMADLQKVFIGKTDALFAACCGDQRNETLHSRVVELIAYLDEAMALQTSTKVPKLSSSRLNELETVLHHACSVQQELGIPDSLLHGDINPGNILYDGNRCVFTDWCEASVGNPFVTLEQMCVHSARKSPEPELWARALRDEYKSCWIDLLTERQVDRGLQLAPLLSVLSSLHGRGNWLESPRRYDPSRLSYSRSLARHIDRVVQTPGLQEALCH
jgi:thiamine kinase-like enzyme